MRRYKGLPLYEVLFDDSESVFNNVAFVTEPAIGENFVQLSKQENIQLAIDEEKRIIINRFILHIFVHY